VWAIFIICMDFLAIDLEACNSYIKGSVFSIGIVCADENFNIKYKRNLFINPKCKFAMHFRKPIDFHVDMNDVLASPPLEDYYDELKNIFSGDVIVLAHSANNDMYMLNHALKRAGLPQLKFQYICSQLIYSAVYDYPNGIGLDKVSEDLNIGFTHHRADDDAEMCLYLLKHCIEKAGCTSYLMLEKKLKITRGYIENYELYPMHSKVLDDLRQKHRVEKVKIQNKLAKEVEKNDVVIMSVGKNYFDMLRCGTKKYELRLLDEKRKKINVGDIIYFKKEAINGGYLKTKIVSIDYQKSFLDVYGKYPTQDLGFKDMDLIDFLGTMSDIYKPEEEKELGVVVLGIEVLEG